MPFLTRGKTNWKYILILLILAAIVGGGILGYLNYFKKETISLSQIPEIKKPEKIIEEKPKLEEEVCFKGKLEGEIVKEITDNSLYKLIIHTLVEKAKDYGFTKEEICAAQKYYLNGEGIDLNEDGILEYFIFPESILIEQRKSVIRGASGNGPIYSFGFFQQEWKLIGEMEGNWLKPIKSRRTNGYYNLAAHWHFSAVSGEIAEYAWNGEKYELIKTIQYGPDTPNPLGPPEEYRELWEG